MLPAPPLLRQCTPLPCILTSRSRSHYSARSTPPTPTRPCTNGTSTAWMSITWAQALIATLLAVITSSHARPGTSCHNAIRAGEPAPCTLAFQVRKLSIINNLLFQETVTDVMYCQRAAKSTNSRPRTLIFNFKEPGVLSFWNML